MSDNLSQSERKARPSSQAGKSRILWLLAIPGLIVAGLLIFFLGFSTAGEEDKKTAAPEAPRGMPVEAVQVTVEPVNRELAAVGTLQSDESVLLSTEVAGLVQEIAFGEGERATAGQVLIRLDDSVTRAELDRARASLELSLANYKRAELLLKDDAIAERERDEAYARWQLDQANVRLAEANLAKTVIRAPFAGRLGLRDLSPGAYLRPGDPIVQLDAIDPIKVDFNIPESFAGQVRVGQSLAVRVDAMPGRSFAGVVSAIAPQLDTQGRSLLVRARLDNQDRILNPGMFARISLVLETREKALMVPEEALIAQGEQQLVYKVVDDKVEASPVRLGIRQRGQVEIRQGLQAGDTVITAGHIKVRPGMPVTVLPPTANAESKKEKIREG